MNEYSCFTLLLSCYYYYYILYSSIQNLGMYSFFLISIMQLKVERTIELTDLDDVIVNFFFFFLTGCYCNLLPLVGGFWVRIKRRIVYAKLYKRHLVCLSNISTTRGTVCDHSFSFLKIRGHFVLLLL